MGPLAVFGITSDGLNLVLNLLLLFVAVFWIALVYWTYADARRRISDPLLVGCAVAASFFPIAGTLVYMIVRPPEFLDDVRERELEIAAAEARLATAGSLACPYCHSHVEQAFLRCPGCLRRLKAPCGTCRKPLDPTWRICPYCEAEIGEPAAQPRRRARPVAVADEVPRQAPARPRAAAPAERPAAPRQQPAAPRQQPAAPRQQPAAPRRQAAPAAQRQAAPSAQRLQEAAEGRREPPPAPRGAARPGAQSAAAPPAARDRPDPRAKRPARAPRPAEQAPLPTDGNGQQRPRARRPAAKSPTDAATAEQPAARPRARPPSAG